MAWYDPITQAGGAFGKMAESVLTGGASEQAAAAEEAAAKQQDLIKWMTQQQQQAAGKAVGILDEGYNAAKQDAYVGGQQALQTLRQGFDQGQQTLQDYGQQAQGALGQGYQDAQQALGAGVSSAGQTLSPTMGLQSQGTNLANMLASGPYNDFTQDPGYQFRLQQGQEAIQNAASAAGGRMGGDTLKALTEYNQNFASNEYGNYVNRQNDVMGMMANLAGMGANAAGQYAGMQYGAGSQGAGLGMQYGTGLGSMLGMQGAQLADMQTGGAQAMAGQQNMNWQAMMGLQTGGAQAKANALTGGAAGQNDIMSMMLPTYGAGVPYAGATGAGLNQLGQAAMMYYFLSDERAKTNVERGESVSGRVQEFLGELEPVSFDYRDTKHGEGRHTGVMAQAVERSEIGRELVTETRDGKALDIRKTLSAVLAALGNINARLEALESRHG